jgi:hypothetical protein
MDTSSSATSKPSDSSTTFIVEDDDHDVVATQSTEGKPLAAVDIPKARSYTSEEYTLMNHFEKTFGTFALLSADGATYTCKLCPKTNNTEKAFHASNAKKHFADMHATHPDLHGELRLAIITVLKDSIARLKGKAPSTPKDAATNDVPAPDPSPKPLSRKELRKALARMIVLGNLPTDISRRPDIIYLFQKVLGVKKLPSRTTIRRDIKELIIELMGEKADFIAKQFEEVRADGRTIKISLHGDSDKWRSPWGYDYINLNISGITTGWKYLNINVGLVYFPGKHTAADIIRMWKEMLEQRGLTIESLSYMYTDNESSMKKAAAEAKVQWYGCCCHNLNLVNTDVHGIDGNFYSNALLHAQVFVAPFGTKSYRSDLLQLMISKNGIEPKALVHDMVTRWWVKNKMFERIIHVMPGLHLSPELLAKEFGIDIAKVHISWCSSFKWLQQHIVSSKLKELVKLLKPAEIVSAMWETREFVNISLVLPGVLMLRNFWMRANLSVAEGGLGLCEEVGKVATMLRNSLERRFYYVLDAKTNGFYAAATLLDPLTHNYILEYQEHATSGANFILDHCLKREFVSNPSPQAPSTQAPSTQVKKRTSVYDGWKSEAESYNEKVKKQLDSELATWEVAIEEAANADKYSLDFYNKAPINLFLIPRVARDILGGKASSAASESLFSTAKHGFPPHRATTDPKIAGQRFEARMTLLEKVKISTVSDIDALDDEPPEDDIPVTVDASTESDVVGAGGGGGSSVSSSSIKRKPMSNENANTTTTTSSSNSRSSSTSTSTSGKISDMLPSTVTPLLKFTTKVKAMLAMDFKKAEPDGPDIGRIQEELIYDGVLQLSLSGALYFPAVYDREEELGMIKEVVRDREEMRRKRRFDHQGEGDADGDADGDGDGGGGAHGGGAHGGGGGATV